MYRKHVPSGLPVPPPAPLRMWKDEPEQIMRRELRRAAAVMYSAMIVLAALWSLVVITGCAGEDDAVSAMRRAGYTDITVTESYYVTTGWQGCSNGDNAAFDVSATAANKQRVTATVCCGTLKKCTIRF